MHIEDGEILQLLSEGKTRDRGFLLLVQKYQQKLYWHIRRLVSDHDETEDILQNTLIKAWKGLKKFRGDSQLFTWLYRIATNEALTALKRNKRYRAYSLDEAEREIDGLSGNDVLYNGDEISNKLQAAILTLPAKQRLVFNMKYFDELKYDEMSEILGTSSGALKASYHLAVKKIEKSVLKD